MRSPEVRHRSASGSWGISRHVKTSATVDLKNSDPPLAPISHDSVVRQRSYAHPAIPRDGEKMIYDRGRIQNPISLLVNDRLQRAVLTVICRILAKASQVSVICLAT